MVDGIGEERLLKNPAIHGMLWRIHRRQRLAKASANGEPMNGVRKQIRVCQHPLRKFIAQNREILKTERFQGLVRARPDPSDGTHAGRRRGRPTRASIPVRSKSGGRADLFRTAAQRNLRIVSATRPCYGTA